MSNRTQIKKFNKNEIIGLEHVFDNRETYFTTALADIDCRFKKYPIE